MLDESIFFLQENDVVCFFTHRFCLIKKKEQQKSCKKGNFKLRLCCVDCCEVGVI